MEKLIKADTLLEQIDSPYTEYPVIIQIRRAIKEMINNAPTVDSKPVKHGHWEWTDDPRTGDFVCSNCLDHNIVRSRYCPNCGAIMDEVEE